jgi:N4-gp56 family major capsid protein
MAAIKDSKFMQFVKAEPGYGKGMGDTINITRISNVTVPSSAALLEGVRISEDAMTISVQAITVGEFGRAIPFTSIAKDLSTFDLQNTVQSKIKDQMELVLDASASTAFKAGKVKAILAGVSSVTFDTDGTPSTPSVVNLNVYAVEQIRDYMYATLNIKPYSSDEYVALISYKAARGLKSDPDWQDWKKYTDPGAKFNGELGKIENVRFVEVNNTSSLSDAKGTGSVLGEGVFFGDDAVVMAVAQEPELRIKAAEDYGRAMGVAWYGIYNFGQVWSDSSTAGEARVVHLTSS